jgi:membrane fusion protein (multidrug efflux system)
MTDATAPDNPNPPARRTKWIAPVIRSCFLIGAGWLVWEVAGHWNSWIGAARFQTSDDAYIAGDLTPLSAKVSGYISTIAVEDFQSVQRGDLIAEIEPSDYQAQLAQAEANLGAARAALANLANQKDVQRALIHQAEAAIAATKADLVRYQLEADRQRTLYQGSVAGTKQLVEQADANANRPQAQLQLNNAQLDQQKAILKSLDVQQEQLTAQVRGAEALVVLARDNLAYTHIVAPADGLVGQRQVRPGEFVNIGTQVIAEMALPKVWVLANYKETQMTNVRLGDSASVTVDAFPKLRLHGHVDSWSPGTGSIFTLLPPDNATGNFTKVVQRVPVKIVLDPDPALGTLVRPGMSVVATIETADIPAAAAPRTTLKTSAADRAAGAPP